MQFSHMYYYMNSSELRDTDAPLHKSTGNILQPHGATSHVLPTHSNNGLVGTTSSSQTWPAHSNWPKSNISLATDHGRSLSRVVKYWTCELERKTLWPRLPHQSSTQEQNRSWPSGQDDALNYRKWIKQTAFFFSFFFLNELPCEYSSFFIAFQFFLTLTLPLND